LLDRTKQVWVAYDNDLPGQTAAKELAERIGTEKCRNVAYPEGIKDANEFMLKFSSKELRELFAKATPFYKYEFSNLADVVDKLIHDPMDYLEIALMPGVKLERDNLVVVSGETNAGKSTYTLNIVRELASRGIPSLFLPIERGVYALGRRYLQLQLNKTQEQMQFTPKDEWSKHILELSRLPVYMAKPSIKDLEATIARAKRLFGVRVVIIDHMDYLIRGAMNKEALISEKMHSLKHCAEENGVIIVVVNHINRGAVMGGQKPTMKNLKGSSSLEQDAEIVVMLYPTEDRLGLEVDVQKNKGPMKKETFKINVDTGLISGTYDPNDF
jgi:predicted ATP-dependent serine protease